MTLVDARVFLTGGTGFFGRALLRHWSMQFRRGSGIPDVTVLARAPEKFLARYPIFKDQHWLSFHAGDILDTHSLPHRDSFTHVLHAAADSTLGPQLKPILRYDQIVAGTRNLLEFAVVSGARRFLFASSGGVYGPQPPGMERIPENYLGMADPLDPANVYSVAKRAAEHLCALYSDAHGLETIVARCFAFVGQDLPLDAHFAIGNFIRDAAWGDVIAVHGDGTAVRSYLDQRDLAGWLLELLARGNAGRAYNVGSDEAIRIGDLAHLVRDTLAPAKKVVILGRTGATAGRNRYVPDISRAQAELGLTVSVRLEQAIRDAASALVATSALP